jgi:hypothetical protein
MMGACAVLEDGVEEPQGIAAPRMSRGFDERPGGTEGGAMRYSFGDYVLDTARQELHQAGAPVQLRRKVFQVLAYLLAHRTRVVPKQELLEQLWPDLFVGDEALTSCVRRLRQVLGERGRTHASCARCTAKATTLWLWLRCRRLSRLTMCRSPSRSARARGPRARPRGPPLAFSHRMLTWEARPWRRWSGSINRSRC